MLRIDYACHVAVLDPMTGSGLLVLPRPGDDVALPTTEAPARTSGAYAPVSEWLHDADFAAVLADLDRRGWEPLEDDGGGMLHEGWTEDGREVVGLYGSDPIQSHVFIEEVAQAHVELHAAVGLVAAMLN